MTQKARALLVVDVQLDFCPGGSLAVPGGDEVVPVINSIMDRFSCVVATQDWHPPGQVSFASNHPGKNPYDTIQARGITQVLWPDHCVAGSPGAAFHPGLRTDLFSLILRKGTDPSIDSYSAFVENDRKTATGLDGYLKSRSVSQIFICGLATDYCVYYSVMDALSAGFTVSVILDACRGINVPGGSLEESLEAMRRGGAAIINSGDLPHA